MTKIIKIRYFRTQKFGFLIFRTFRLVARCCKCDFWNLETISGLYRKNMWKIFFGKNKKIFQKIKFIFGGDFSKFTMGFLIKLDLEFNKKSHCKFREKTIKKTFINWFSNLESSFWFRFFFASRSRCTLAEKRLRNALESQVCTERHAPFPLPPPQVCLSISVWV